MEILNETARRMFLIFSYTGYSLYRVFRDFVLWIVFVADVIAYGDSDHLWMDAYKWLNSIYDRLFKPRRDRG